MSFLDDLLAKGLTKLGDVQFQTRPPKVTAAHCRHAMRLARPGMAICRTFDFFLDGKLIPGHYTHSGIIESQDDWLHAGIVVHAIAEGVQRIDILDFVKDCDGFVLLTFVGTYDIDAAIAKARSLIGTAYDFKFSINDAASKVYCHEMTVTCLHAGGIKIIPALKTIGETTREIYTADCLIEHPQARIVYEAKF